ncbi:flagellar hook-associated protein 3 FlgL [Virgibacillus natechei]|uniref:Flagellar hook-associated protein 3 FlgL n=1 Tax=Virgibacillus natechei TaxID=1216297 RepID=A0ABS4IJM7_9BACI|nr:flagellar hook-associated protein FlgL [Virgibacillus natechei]MBP1971170.1 flagellar hook-associated protein 3 FlgL [Virgibacillus natechei]UZD11917.1 flagellar hook-associated protein FlgL [Virgibacillus natechei]
MRVTQGMLSHNMMRNLSNSNAKLDTYMNQVSTGKKINRPSDDPVTAMKGMNYRSQVTEIQQFQRNTNEVHNWMDNSDAALDQATQAMQNLRELALQASNDTYNADERENMQEEVEQIKEHLIDIANTNVNGKYIFNGTNTDTKPIEVNEDGEIVEIDLNDEAVRIEVADGTKLQANVNSGDVFNDKLFGDIDGFIDALDNNEQPTIEQSIESMDDNINNTINARADLGARMNRLELIENRLNDQEIVATQTMSENEDVDYAKAITELITQESLHRAALSAGARIVQPTLMDFLR